MKRPSIGSEWWAKSSGAARGHPKYKVTGISRGAGELHGKLIVLYKSAVGGEQFSRLLSEWEDTMVPAT